MGHNYLDQSGGVCYCGKTGCVETVLSGTALEKFYTSVTDTKLSLPEIVLKARENEPSALQTLQRLHHFFGKAIPHLINVLDPDIILVGGGVGNIGSLYTEGVKAARQFVFNDHLQTNISRPSLGDSAGVFGAALLYEPTDMV